jgi:hypothetical protein
MLCQEYFTSLPKSSGLTKRSSTYDKHNFLSFSATSTKTNAGEASMQTNLVGIWSANNEVQGQPKHEYENTFTLCLYELHVCYA